MASEHNQPQPHEPHDQQQQQQKHIRIKADDKTMKGVYANAVNLGHTREEFVMDFMNVFGNGGSLNARVIVSPAHAKRLLAALQDNISKYEQQFSEIQGSAQPPKWSFGFEDPDKH